MKKWLYRILMLICVGVFAFSAYQLYLIYSSSKQVEDETAALQEYVRRRLSTTRLGKLAGRKSRYYCLGLCAWMQY